VATLLNLLDDIRDLYDDPADAKVPVARKTRYINLAQQAMFPKVHRVVRDSTLVLAASTYEYQLPAAVTEGKILGFEIETTVSSSRFVRMEGLQFDIVPGGTAQQILVLRGGALPGLVGASIRVTAAMPLTPLAIDADVYSGPAVSEQLPVLYTMSMLMSRLVESRLQYTRFSTTQGLNGTTLEDFMGSGQYWMGLFTNLLEQVAMPQAQP
jgi:hypothetical protein